MPSVGNTSVVAHAATNTILAPPPGFQTGPQYPRQVIIANFVYAEDGQLESFDAGWPSTQDDPNEAPLVKLFSSQPDPDNVPDEKVEMELRREGAKYTIEDKDRLLKDLPRKQLARVLGEFEILSTTFTNASGYPNVSVLGHWTVTVKARKPAGKSANHEVFFEEYGGKIMGIKLVPAQ